MIADQLDARDVLTTKVDDFLNWTRKSSVWYMLFGLACCAIEMMQTGGPRADLDRFGTAPRATPRAVRPDHRVGHADLKMALRTKVLYDQMPEPKYVISMGSCANCGGLFQLAYSVCDGVDKVIPVDVYVPGCPPRPEALTEGLLEAAGEDDAGAVAGPRAERGGRRGASVSAWTPPPSTPRLRARVRHASCRPRGRGRRSPIFDGRRRPRSPRSAAFLRDEPALRFDCLSNLTGVDYPRRRRDRGRLPPLLVPASATGSCSRSTPRDNPALPTVADVWTAANWQEREVFDLLGVTLRRPPRPAPHPACPRTGSAIRCARTSSSRRSTTASRTPRETLAREAA